MDESTISILVVGNPGGTEELSDALRAGGGWSISTGSGGDDTLSRFETERPLVVVIGGTLDSGDGRALVSAMRGSVEPRSFAIVLVGDENGPIKNALDALDFAVDRFVGRPLSVKALAFAVRTCAQAAATARSAAGGEGRLTDAVDQAIDDFVRDAMDALAGGLARAVAEPSEAPAELAAGAPLAGREMEPVSAAAVDETAGAQVAPAPAPEPEPAPQPEPEPEPEPEPNSSSEHDIVASSERAEALSASEGPSADADVSADTDDIWGADVADFDDIWGADAHSGRLNAGGRSQTEVLGPDSGPLAAPSAAVHAEVTRPTSQSAIRSAGESAPTGAVVVTPAIPAAASDDETLDVGGEIDSLWDAPPSKGWREPTMIINPNATAPQPAAAPAGYPGGAPSRPSDVAGPAGVEDGQGADAGLLDDIDDLGSELFDGDPPGSDAEVVPASVSAEATAPTPAPGDTDGGGFAQELRRKMSAMAERLFAGRQGDNPGLDVGLLHDHHTEIDLADLGMETVVGARSDFDAFEDAVTFAGSNAHEEPEASVDTSPRYHDADITESGAIQHLLADTPILIARMHKARFSGRIAFRNEELEKTILFEEGRPVFATSNAEGDRMGDLLGREGKVTAEQYAECRAAAVDSGRRIGEVLVEVGYLKRRELLPAVRRHVEDIIYSLFSWDKGDYRVVSGGAAAKERIRLTRHPAAVVVEGIRRKFTPAILSALVGPSSTIVELADRDLLSATVAAADISAAEREVLFAVDGVRTVEECAAIGSTSLAVANAVIWSGVVLGALSLKRRSDDTQVELDDEPQALLVGETDLAIDRQRVMAKFALVNEADYFALLGVRRDATAFEIKRAYESARKDFAADAFPPELRRELQTSIDDINEVIDEAYRVLRDERVRQSYLQNLWD